MEECRFRTKGSPSEASEMSSLPAQRLFLSRRRIKRTDIRSRSAVPPKITPTTAEMILMAVFIPAEFWDDPEEGDGMLPEEVGFVLPGTSVTSNFRYEEVIDIGRRNIPPSRDKDLARERLNL